MKRKKQKNESKKGTYAVYSQGQELTVQGYGDAAHVAAWSNEPAELRDCKPAIVGREWL